MPRARPDSFRDPLLQLCLPALGETTRLILDRVVTTLRQDAPDLSCDAVQIVLAEALNNVIEHGYGTTRLGAVVVGLQRAGGQIQIDIFDWGLPHPIAAHGAENPPEPTDFAEGGYGVFLIRSLANRVRYRRESGRNHLRVSIAA